MAPECECGGYFKPDTISFGQSMPMKAVERATILSQNCDFFMVIVSTLLIQPAASMPVYAKQFGAFLAIVNLSETLCDGLSDVLFRGVVRILNIHPNLTTGYGNLKENPGLWTRENDNATTTKPFSTVVTANQFL